MASINVTPSPMNSQQICSHSLVMVRKLNKLTISLLITCCRSGNQLGMDRRWQEKKTSLVIWKFITTSPAVNCSEWQ